MQILLVNSQKHIRRVGGFTRATLYQQKTIRYLYTAGIVGKGCGTCPLQVSIAPQVLGLGRGRTRQCHGQAWQVKGPGMHTRSWDYCCAHER